MDGVSKSKFPKNWEEFTNIEDSKERDQVVAELFLEVAKHVKRQAAVRGITGVRVEHLPPNNTDGALNMRRAFRIRRLLREHGLDVRGVWRLQRSGADPLYRFSFKIPLDDCRIQDPSENIAGEMVRWAESELQVGKLNFIVAPRWQEPTWQTRSFEILDQLYRNAGLEDTVEQFTFLRGPLTQATGQDLLRQAAAHWTYWPGVVWKIDDKAHLYVRRYKTRPDDGVMTKLRDHDWQNVERLHSLRSSDACQDCC